MGKANRTLILHIPSETDSLKQISNSAPGDFNPMPHDNTDGPPVEHSENRSSYCLRLRQITYGNIRQADGEGGRHIPKYLNGGLVKPIHPPVWI